MCLAATDHRNRVVDRPTSRVDLVVDLAKCRYPARQLLARVERVALIANLKPHAELMGPAGRGSRRLAPTEAYGVTELAVPQGIGVLGLVIDLRHIIGSLRGLDDPVSLQQLEEKGEGGLDLNFGRMIDDEGETDLSASRLWIDERPVVVNLENMKAVEHERRAGNEAHATEADSELLAVSHRRPVDLRRKGIQRLARAIDVIARCDILESDRAGIPGLEAS